MWTAMQPYTRTVFKRFFKLRTRALSSDTDRLRDLTEQLEGLGVKAQLAVSQLLREASSEQLPGPLDKATEALRRHNSSLPHLEGKCVYGKILKVERRFVWIDVGIRSYTRVAKKELNVSQLVASRSGGGHRTGPADFRIGDVLTFFIEDLETPFGDMLLQATGQASQSLDYDAVWASLLKHHRDKTPIKGRILNSVNGGYAVGVAGHVGFCPGGTTSAYVASRIGVLQPFLIKTVSSTTERRNIVLADYRYQVQLPARYQAREQRMLPPPEATSEDEY